MGLQHSQPPARVPMRFDQAVSIAAATGTKRHAPPDIAQALKVVETNAISAKGADIPRAVAAVTLSLQQCSGPQDAPTAAAACAALSKLAVVLKEAPHGKKADMAAATASVVAVMSVYAKDASVAAAACEALGLPLPAAPGQARETATAVLAALQAHGPVSVAVAHEAAWTLGVLEAQYNLRLGYGVGTGAATDPQASRLVDTGDAVAAVVTAMRAHAGDRDVARGCCYALSVLAADRLKDGLDGDSDTASGSSPATGGNGSVSGGGSATAVVTADGATAAVVASLRAFPEDERLASAGCNALARMASGAAANAARVLAEDGAVDAVLAVLQAHPGGMAGRSACAALNTLVAFPLSDAQLRLVNSVEPVLRNVLLAIEDSTTGSDTSQLVLKASLQRILCTIAESESTGRQQNGRTGNSSAVGPGLDNG